MATQKVLFEAEDGTLFESEIEAQAHDAAIDNADKIEAFLDKHFPEGELELVRDDNGEPVLNKRTGEPRMVRKQNNGRAYARKTLALWIAENV